MQTVKFASSSQSGEGRVPNPNQPAQRSKLQLSTTPHYGAQTAHLQHFHNMQWPNSQPKLVRVKSLLAAAAQRAGEARKTHGTPP